MQGVAIHQRRICCVVHSQCIVNTCNNNLRFHEFLNCVICLSRSVLLLNLINVALIRIRSVNNAIILI